jgi:hypothetical protein
MEALIMEDPPLRRVCLFVRAHLCIIAGYSPWYSRGLEVRSHRLEVMPMGAECGERETLSIDFDII